MAGYVKRVLGQKLEQQLKDYPVVALLGPRQVGKSTLAQRVIKKRVKSVYLDLERPSHLNQLNSPEYFFEQNKQSLICLDEIQRCPEIFPLLRSLVDERKRNGQFLILGSAGKELLKQSSESLAGRICYLEMSPFTVPEIPTKNLEKLWVRGGFPKSFLSQNETASLDWRENYIQTFLERDIPQLGIRISSVPIRRLWAMLAYSQGQTLNSSKLASSLGISSHTVNSYIRLLEKTFLIRLLQPFSENLKKRLIKSPKVYIRDSGLLHALLKIDTMNELFSHPVFGSSFEGFVLEQILYAFPRCSFYFYRARSGAEIDLLMIKGTRRIAIEIKAGKSPTVKKGFWAGVEDVNAKEKYLIAPVDRSYSLKGQVKVMNLSRFLKLMKPKFS